MDSRIELTEKIIIGIDPGTNVTGYGIIRSFGQNLELISLGTIQLDRYGSHHKKLTVLFNKVYSLLKRYDPDELAIEAPFYAKNPQSLLKLGRAQGVAIAATMTRNMPVFEYSPRKVKQAITGNGNASKEQVAQMLMHTLKVRELSSELDATDGLAVAICHHYQRTNPLAQLKGKKSWESYVRENPHKIKD